MAIRYTEVPGRQVRVSADVTTSSGADKSVVGAPTRTKQRRSTRMEIRLSQDLLDHFAAKCEKQGESVSVVVRDLMMQWADNAD